MITSDLHGDVIGLIPDSFNFDLASEWGQLIDSPGSSGLGTVVQELTGYSTISKKTSAQRWQGSSTIDLSLSISLVAESNASAEIIEPVSRLARMALPRASEGQAGFLAPPGPRLFRQNEEGNDRSSDRIDISIGEFLRFENIIITSVNPTFSGHMLPDGRPSSAEVGVNFRTFYIFDSSELERSMR